MGHTAASSGSLAEPTEGSVRACMQANRQAARAHLQLSERTQGASDQHSRRLQASREPS